MAFAFQRDTVGFLRYALSHDRECPTYWQTGGKTPPYLVNVDFKTRAAIQNLIDNTWSRREVGEGRDARGLNYEQIVVLDVQRVENTQLFGVYRNARRNMLRKYIQNNQVCYDISRLGRKRQGVLTTQLLPDSMTADLYHEINEHYIFHGTTVDRIGALVTHGFNVQQSSDDNLFGAGIYGAEKAIKADQYADPTHARSPHGNRLKLILSRMLLGNPMVLDHPYKSPLPASYDSIIAKGWKYREFVVKDDAQVYPEYVITYTRNETSSVNYLK